MDLQRQRLNAYLDSLSKDEYDDLVWYFDNVASGWNPPIKNLIEERENAKIHEDQTSSNTEYAR
jgi:hypothetical protein